MKKITIAVVALVSVTGGFMLGRYFATPTFSEPKNSRGQHDPLFDEVVETWGRAVILLIDGSDVYCAKDKVDDAGLEDYVIKTMELNHVKQVVVAGSIATRYGDFVAFIDRLRKQGIKVQTISTRATSPGTRLPLIYP